VSADFSYQSGELTTVPLRFRGGRLELNIDTGAGGIARIGLCDADGRFFAGHSKEDCDPVRTNSVAQTVAWRGSADLTALQDKPVKLAFEMRDASLFAFQFQT
ncbi:MAG: hypothetical protein NTY38_33030, partial [Acidobacteria bacterium]|nr:hypothetical protein [Acidobacteriota bacterium]